MQEKRLPWFHLLPKFLLDRMHPIWRSQLKSISREEALQLVLWGCGWPCGRIQREPWPTTAVGEWVKELRKAQPVRSTFAFGYLRRRCDEEGGPVLSCGDVPLELSAPRGRIGGKARGECPSPAILGNLWIHRSQQNPTPPHLTTCIFAHLWSVCLSIKDNFTGGLVPKGLEVLETLVEITQGKILHAWREARA